MSCSFKTADIVIKKFILMAENWLVIVCVLYVTQKDSFCSLPLISQDTELKHANFEYHSAENKQPAQCIIPSALLTCCSTHET